MIIGFGILFTAAVLIPLAFLGHENWLDWRITGRLRPPSAALTIVMAIAAALALVLVWTMLLSAIGGAA